MGNVTIKEIEYGNWGKCVQLSNGIIDLVATIELGPRIIRYGFTNGDNMFYEAKEGKSAIGKEEFSIFGGGAWCLYGGHRLWHSPEYKQRTYFPDNSEVYWERINNGIKLSPKEEKWVQIKKEIEVIINENDTHITLIHRITNTGAWEIEFAPWALTVMAAGGKEIIPQTQRDTGLLGNRVLALWPYTKMNDKRVYWGEKYITLEQNPNKSEPFKIGLSNEDGWAAYINKGNMFVKYYNHIENGVYPDFGVSYETYTNDFMVEMESLGQLKKVAPGEAVEHVEEWKLCENVSMPSNDENEIDEVVKKYI